MVEQGESCQDILAQLMAARAGLDQAGQILLDQELERCLSQRLPPDQARLTALRRALRLRARFS
jgi:DNA-binding FrmR family transcriptional regulator